MTSSSEGTAAEQADLVALIRAADDTSVRRQLRRLVLIVDLGCASVWMFGPSSHWSGASYRFARALFGFLPVSWQLRPSGFLVLILTLGIIATGHRHRRIYYLLSLLTVAVWWFWALAFMVSAFLQPDGLITPSGFLHSPAGLLGPVVFSGWAVLHQLLVKTSGHLR